MKKSILSFKEFQVLREGICGRKDVLMIGVDVAKRKHVACMCGVGRKVLVRSYGFSNTRSGFEDFRDVVTDVMGAYGFSEVVVGLESTGLYQKPLEEFLRACGYYLVSVSNLASARNRETIELSWEKSDPKDAEAIADLVLQGKFLYHVCREDRREMVRRLLRLRRRLMRELTRCLVRIRNSILPVVFPELDGAFSRLDGALALRLFELGFFPREIVEQPLEVFLDQFRGLKGPFPRKKLAEIYALAHRSIGIRRGIEAYRLELSDLVDDIRLLKARIGNVEKKMTDVYRDETVFTHLQTIPGVGAITAAILMAEIGPIENFESVRQVIKFAGLNIVSKQSGEYQGIRVISKMGNLLLRSALYHAALAAAHSQSPLGNWYKSRSEQRGVPKKKLLIALAGKILRIAFGIMKHKTPYRANYDKLLKIKQRHREVMSRLNKETA